MEPDSPFINFGEINKISHNTTICVNYCEICHHVWKAPTIAAKCINCRNDNTPKVLVMYETEVPRT